MRLSFKLIQDKEFRARVSTLRKSLGNLNPLYKAWGMETLKWIQLNYRTGGAKVGGWKKLRPLTVQSRRQRSDKPLLDTGHLMRQWNWRLRSWGVEVGNPSEIAEYHEEGTKPYTIRPKTAKALWFGVTPIQRRKKKGGGIFAKKVEHPGLPKRRQLPTEAEIMPVLVRVADVFLERAIK